MPASGVRAPQQTERSALRVLPRPGPCGSLSFPPSQQLSGSSTVGTSSPQVSCGTHNLNKPRRQGQRSAVTPSPPPPQRLSLLELLPLLKLYLRPQS